MTDLQIDGYEIICKLGYGGMAQVYLARELSLHREVAIKVLPFHLLENDDSKKRFEREAKTIARLDHRSIVPVYGYGEGNLGPFLAMRYMRGGSLLNRLERGVLSLAEAVNILDRIADGLDKAHKAGVVHRDIKPANILFDEDGRAYLADFGVVKLANPDISITRSDAFVGTPAYMSPESFKDVEVDGRADIYALGVMLYQMLTGLLPYSALTPLRLIEQHVSGPLPSVRDIDPTLPDMCDKVVQKAMAKDSNDRYQTARAMVDDLKRTVPVSAETKPFGNGGIDDEDGDVERPYIWYGLAVIVFVLLGWMIFIVVKPSGGDVVTPTTAVTEPVTIAIITNTPLPTETKAIPPDMPTKVTAEMLTATPLLLTETTTAVPVTLTHNSTAEPSSTATAVIVQMETTTTDVNLYGGPSTENHVLGLLVRGVTVEVIGKVDNASWYEVRTETGKEGWVDANQVAFISGTADDAAITWPRSANTPVSGTAVAATSLPFCSGVTVERDELGDFHVLWTNYPVATDHLWLSVYGAASGDPLVYPNNIDQNDPDWAENGFTIGKWLFEQRGFPQNTTYQYIMKAIDSAGSDICSISDSFVN